MINMPMGMPGGAPNMPAMTGGAPPNMPSMTGAAPPNMPTMNGGGQPSLPTMSGAAPPNMQGMQSMPAMANMQPMTKTSSSSAGGSIPVQAMGVGGMMGGQYLEQQYPGYPGYTMVPGTAPPPTPPLHSTPG